MGMQNGSRTSQWLVLFSLTDVNHEQDKKIV